MTFIPLEGDQYYVVGSYGVFLNSASCEDYGVETVERQCESNDSRCWSFCFFTPRKFIGWKHNDPQFLVYDWNKDGVNDLFYSYSIKIGSSSQGGRGFIVDGKALSKFPADIEKNMADITGFTLDGLEYGTPQTLVMRLIDLNNDCNFEVHLRL